MSSINFHTKEIAVKIVYYGPGLCGKTTSLQSVYRSLPEKDRPQLVSLATEVDRTIFFDFLPLTAYRIRDFKVRLQLYTVPGQVFYNATRKLVVNGVDGIVFVADSQRAMKDSNLESLQNLSENLSELGLEIDNIPMVMQFNKRDLGDIFTIEQMDRLYNTRQVSVFATVATTGEGLFDTLKAISQMVVNDLIRKGLGHQLAEQVRRQEAIPARREEPSEAPPPPSDGFSAVGAVVSQMARSALWPPGETSRLGEIAAQAVKDGRWRDAVLAVERLLKHEVQRWAVDEGGAPVDAMATFLYLRGVPATRYRAFLQSLVSARSGRAINRGSAMNALVMALEVLW